MENNLTDNTELLYFIPQDNIMNRNILVINCDQMYNIYNDAFRNNYTMLEVIYNGNFTYNCNADFLFNLPCLKNLVEIKLKCYSLRETLSDISIIERNIIELLYRCPKLLKITLIDFEFENSIIEVINIFENLYYLDLSYNNITSVKNLRLPKLQYLNLSNNNIIKFNFNNYPFLRILNLNNNQIKKCVNVNKAKYLSDFEISNNSLTSITLNSNMRKFNVSNNIDLCEIKTFKKNYKLEILYISNTRIDDISFLKEMPILFNLNISRNKFLTSIESLRYCTYLENLIVSYTSVSSIEPLKKLNLLNFLSINYTNVEDISILPPNLRDLECIGNKIDKSSFLNENIEIVNLTNCGITDIDWLFKNKNLSTIIISDNPIVDVQNVVSLERLVSIDISGCPIDPQTLTEDLMLFLENIIFNPSDIIEFLLNDNDDIDEYDEDIEITFYEKNENVHESTIHNSLINNINRIEDLTSSYQQYPINQLILDIFNEYKDVQYIDDKNIFFEFIIKTLFSNERLAKNEHISITFYYLLVRIWCLIKLSEHKDELLKILYQEIKDSYNLCFVGLMTRTTNTLSGYYDFNFTISLNQQLNSIVINEKRKLADIGDESNELLKENFKKRCIELQIDNMEIDKWINYIDESI